MVSSLINLILHIRRKDTFEGKDDGASFLDSKYNVLFLEASKRNMGAIGQGHLFENLKHLTFSHVMHHFATLQTSNVSINAENYMNLICL